MNIPFGISLLLVGFCAGFFFCIYTLSNSWRRLAKDAIEEIGRLEAKLEGKHEYK